MAIYYVSNTMSNGYGLSSDTTGTGTQAAPYATINKAVSVAAASGDTIMVNGTATAYAETSGSNFLSISKIITIKGDPTGGVQPTLSGAATSASRILNCNTTVILQNFALDCTGNTTLTTVVNYQGAVGCQFIQCTIKNFAPTVLTYAFVGAASSAGTITIDRCSLSTSNGNSATTAALINLTPTNIGTITILGCTISGISTILGSPATSTTYPNINFGASSDGTRNTFTTIGSTMNIPNNSAGYTGLTWDSIDFVAYGAITPLGDYAGTVTTNWTISNCTYAGTGNAVNLAGTHTNFNHKSGTFNTNVGLIFSGTLITPLLNYNIFNNTSIAVSLSGAITNMKIFGSRFTNPASVNANQYGINITGTINGLSIARCSFAAAGYPTALIINVSATATCKGLYFKKNTVNGYTVATILLRGSGSGTVIDENIFQGSGGLVQCASVLQNNITVSKNQITQYNSSTGVDAVSIYSGPGIRAFGNTIYTDGVSVHGIMFGIDGLSSVVTNTVNTTLQNLGDTAADSYFAQPFTFIANTAVNNSVQIAGVEVSLQKVGSPTGTINAYLYTNVAGAPGTLIATSDYSMSAANLTGTSQFVHFYFYTRFTAAYSGTYFIVIKYTGTNDNTNYVQLLANTTGPGQTSTTGSSWTSSTNAAIFNVLTGNYENVNPIAYNNKIESTNLGTPQMHGVFHGAVSGGKAYANEIWGGGPLLCTKLVDGSVTPYYGFSNIVYTFKGTQQCFRDKGSRNTNFINNTAVVYAAEANCICADNDVRTSYNAQPSVNFNAQNNNMILLCLYANLYAVVKLGSGIAQVTCSNPTLANNNYWIVASSDNSQAPILVMDARTSSPVNYTTLAAWQTASGLDGNSLNVDPLLAGELFGFRSPADFAPKYNSVLNQLGNNANVTNCPFDFNGDTFSSTPPPIIGAINGLKLTRLT